MEQRLQEYVEYYRVRAGRVAANPLYPESARTEGALLEAFESSATVEEAGAKVEAGGLPAANARALVRDQEQARAELYDRLEEPVRAAVSRRVLSAVEGIEDPVELANAASRARTEAQQTVLVDELVRSFEADVLILERLAVLREAEVPAGWRSELDQEAADLLSSTAAVWAEARYPEARRWDPQWTFRPELVSEPRHRRRLPFADPYLERLLEEHRRTGWT